MMVMGGGGITGRAAGNFEIEPIQIPTFQEKVTHSYTNRPNFGLNYLIFLSHILEILKNQPIHIPYFA